MIAVPLAGVAGSQQLLATLQEEVRLVEEELGRLVASQVRMVQDVGTHTLGAGGKRLRPAFVSLAAQATGLPFDAARARRIGACMEMIHMATLIHDDVIDHSSMRRGLPTAAKLFGNTAAILSGDALLARALAILAADGDLDVIQTVSQSVVEIVEGEVRELELRGVFDLDEDAHLEVLRLKTASFIQCCCEVGAILSGAPSETRQALRLYGHHIGLAFQIVDDLLDYRGDHARTGKPVAIDFREAQATLPLIYLRPHLDGDELAETRAHFGNGVTDEHIRQIVRWMGDRGAFEKAETKAKAHLAEGQAALSVIEDSPAKSLLLGVSDFVFTRQA
jgi:octaprenyl-diphosphate synthase